MTGFSAVCHTTHWLSYSAHRPLVVAHVVQVHLARLAVGAGAGDPERRRRSCPSSGARSWPDRAGTPRRRRAARPPRGRRRCAPAPGSSSRGRAGARVCSTPMNSSPRPYLKVTRFASSQRGISSTSSCSTLTHSTGPMPSGNSNTSGSLNGGVVYQPRVLLPDDGRVQALLDRRPDAERRGEDLVAVVVAHDEVRAVAHAELVDLAEQVVGGVPGEHVAQPRLDAHADEGEPPRGLPVGRLRELVVAELHARLGVRVGRDAAPTGSSPCRGSRRRRRARPRRWWARTSARPRSSRGWLRVRARRTATTSGSEASMRARDEPGGDLAGRASPSIHAIGALARETS